MIPRHLELFLLLLAALSLLLAGAAGAGPPPDRMVDDDLADCPAAGHTTVLDAVTAAAPGDVILICPGTYSEPKITVDKPLELIGSGTGNTFVESASADILFLMQTGDFRIRDVTLRNAFQALRWELIAAVFDDVEISNVRFENHSSRAVEIHNQTTVTNLRVLDSHFENNPHGIRLSSAGIVDGLTVTGSTFTDQAIGIYLLNGGGSSMLRDVLVSGSTFTNHTTAGIFVEEIRDALIENNSFEGNGRGITIFKNYTGSGVGVENVTIRENKFTDHPSGAFLLWQLTSALSGPVDFSDNTIDQDVGLLPLDFGMIDIRLDTTFNHAAVTVTDNQVTFSGAFTGGALAAHGVKLRGSLTDVLIETNTFDGGGVGDLGGLPPTSAIFIQTDDGTFGAVPASSVVDILCNVMTDLVNGVSVHDPLAALPGGLPSGAAVTMRGNAVSGNSGLGVDNSGTSETIAAADNWWGHASGPSGQGPGIGDAISTNVTVDPFITIPVSGCASLTLTKVDLADPVDPGDPLDYVITVSNAGPSDAIDVVVTETLPGLASFVSTSGCAEDPLGVPACTLGTIPEGGVAQYTVSVTAGAPASGILTNLVAVTADQHDFNPGDNTATEPTAVVVADLVIDKQATAPDPLMLGEAVTFDFTATNLGPVDATNTVMTDPLPPQVVFQSSPCATAAGNLVTWFIGDLAVGAVVNCSITVTLLGSGDVTNTAVITADQTDPDTDNNTSTVTVVGLGVVGVPALGPAGLVLLSLLLATGGWRLMRRRGQTAGIPGLREEDLNPPEPRATATPAAPSGPPPTPPPW